MHARAFVLAGLTPPLLLHAVAVHAQSREIGSTAATVYADDREYREQPLRLGGLTVSIASEARVEYDSNVFAEPDNENDDMRFELSPSVRVRTPPGVISAQASASGTVRRFAQEKTENTETWLVDGQVRWELDKVSLASGRIFAQRAIEERGDPESNIGQRFGPRRTDIQGVEARYKRDPGRLMFDVEATATRFDAVSRLDDTRDFKSYTARTTVGLRTTSALFVTATGFVALREFRLDRTPLGIKRDSMTYGARLGVDIRPMGLFEGNFSAGVFRFDPDEPTAKGRTGLSVSGNLIYRPRRRTAVLLNAFRGDVATFRNGAQQRTDATVRLSVQQEVRHNLLAAPFIGYRKTTYNGSGDKQRTFTMGAEVEYLFSRRMSLSAFATYGKRDSDDQAADNFKRLRGGLSLRMRF